MWGRGRGDARPGDPRLASRSSTSSSLSRKVKETKTWFYRSPLFAHKKHLLCFSLLAGVLHCPSIKSTAVFLLFWEIPSYLTRSAESELKLAAKALIVMQVPSRSKVGGLQRWGSQNRERESLRGWHNCFCSWQEESDWWAQGQRVDEVGFTNVTADPAQWKNLHLMHERISHAVWLRLYF